jgi:hypothetical protein
LPHDEVTVHIIVPGTNEEVEQLKQEKQLQFDIHAVGDFIYHEQFQLVEKGPNNTLEPLRGYGLVENGMIIESGEDDYVGIHAVRLINKLVE